ncbi:hypothetical protein L3Y34_014788 [Caenorhabditis briggsae]|uniref:Uncharacterized protein n=1 Tax=Caenorhabditis briggsae TaxID=6238 RepID=A0AAE9DSR8_CAEBR|nr:hypothetical protein L3Y34_014788 [Caenorhabditis briggsae]
MNVFLITFLLVSTAFSDKTPSINDHISLRVAEGILDVFNRNAFENNEFLDFDPNFVYDNCRDKISKFDFTKGLRDWRANFPTGTLVKYTLLDIHPIPRNFDGVDFTLHVAFTEMGAPHVDMRFNLKRIRDPDATHRWTWMNSSRLCGDHLIIPSTAMRTFNLY